MECLLSGDSSVQVLVFPVLTPLVVFWASYSRCSCRNRVITAVRVLQLWVIDWFVMPRGPQRGPLWRLEMRGFQGLVGSSAVSIPAHNQTPALQWLPAILVLFIVNIFCTSLLLRWPTCLNNPRSHPRCQLWFVVLLLNIPFKKMHRFCCLWFLFVF